jgi:hypothetical protein
VANIFTRKGRDIVAARMTGGGSPTQVEPKIVAWGTGGAGGPFTAANPDVALFAEAAETRITGTGSQVTVTTTSDTYQVTGTITATGTRAITEVGLFDSTTKPATATVAAGGVVASSSATTLNTAATFSPGNNNYIQIRTEVMQVTAGSGSTALTVVRGQNGSTAIATIAVSDNVTAGNPPGQTGVTGGSMFVHADFAVINLSTNDSIAFTIQVTWS